MFCAHYSLDAKNYYVTPLNSTTIQTLYIDRTMKDFQIEMVVTFEYLPGNGLI